MAIWNPPGLSHSLGRSLKGPYDEDFSVFGFILGSPCFGKLPYHFTFFTLSPCSSDFYWSY